MNEYWSDDDYLDDNYLLEPIRVFIPTRKTKFVRDKSGYLFLTDNPFRIPKIINIKCGKDGCPYEFRELAFPHQITFNSYEKKPSCWKFMGSCPICYKHNLTITRIELLSSEFKPLQQIDKELDGKNHMNLPSYVFEETIKRKMEDVLNTHEIVTWEEGNVEFDTQNDRWDEKLRELEKFLKTQRNKKPHRKKKQKFKKH